MPMLVEQFKLARERRQHVLSLRCEENVPRMSDVVSGNRPTLRDNRRSADRQVLACPYLQHKAVGRVLFLSEGSSLLSTRHWYRGKASNYKLASVRDSAALPTAYFRSNRRFSLLIHSKVPDSSWMSALVCQRHLRSCRLNLTSPGWQITAVIHAHQSRTSNTSSYHGSKTAK